MDLVIDFSFLTALLVEALRFLEDLLEDLQGIALLELKNFRKLFQDSTKHFGMLKELSARHTNRFFQPTPCIPVFLDSSQPVAYQCAYVPF